jgi:hypothetical protein
MRIGLLGKRSCACPMETSVAASIPTAIRNNGDVI